MGNNKTSNGSRNHSEWCQKRTCRFEGEQMEQVRSKNIDLEAVQRLLMAEVKTQSAQLLTGALRLELHFLRGQVVKVRATQQRYLKDERLKIA